MKPKTSEGQCLRYSLKMHYEQAQSLHHSYIRQAHVILTKIVSEYDQEILQSQTADNPWHREDNCKMAPKHFHPIDNLILALSWIKNVKFVLALAMDAANLYQYYRY